MIKSNLININSNIPDEIMVDIKEKSIASKANEVNSLSSPN